MTALTDAISAATTLVGSSTHTNNKALVAAKLPGGTTDVTIATYLGSLRDAGLAIKAAGGDWIQAGLKDTNGDPITANNGWLGRKDRTHGEEGVEGVCLAGVDYACWDVELRTRNF